LTSRSRFFFGAQGFDGAGLDAQGLDEVLVHFGQVLGLRPS
jgi:hypothetical protein